MINLVLFKYSTLEHTRLLLSSFNKHCHQQVQVVWVTIPGYCQAIECNSYGFLASLFFDYYVASYLPKILRYTVRLAEVHFLKYF